MVVYSQCPVCGGTNIQFVFDVRDFTVSGDTFPVFECADCTARFTNNVPSEDEIGAYYKSEDYISHSETSKGIVNTLYHTIRRYTLQKKKNLVHHESGKDNGNILDLGSGTGALPEVMKTAGWLVKGLEPDENARKIAETRGVDVSSINQFFHLPENSFDVITMWHVLEHVHRLHEYFEHFQKILKPDGVLVIAIPNYTSQDALHYRSFWAAYDVPRHLYHFSPNSIRVLTEKHGFKVDSIKPMWFDSFYVSMLSEKYKKNGSIGLIKAVWNGFISNANAVSDTGKCSSLIYVIRRIT